MTWTDVLVVLVGLITGLFSGTIGIGGGLFFVPFMTVGLRFAQTLAQGTSLAAIIPTAAVGGFTHLRQGNAVKEAAVWMGIGGAVGAILGAGFALYVPAGILARVFGLFLLFSAYRIFQSSRRAPAKDAPRETPA